MRSKYLIAALLATAAIAQPVQAGHFLFQYQAVADQSDAGSAMTATVNLTTSDLFDGTGYLVTAVSGTIDGVAIDNLYANPNAPGFAVLNTHYEYDNEVLPGSGVRLDGYGVMVSAGGLDFNLVGLGIFDPDDSGPAGVGNIYAIISSPLGVPNSQFDKFSLGYGSLTAVPEPLSWVMMVGGFGLAGAAMRRHRSVIRFA